MERGLLILEAPSGESQGSELIVPEIISVSLVGVGP